jgi:hypothetical protein
VGPGDGDPALWLASGIVSFRQMRGTASAMSTAMMMTRPMRIMARSLR